MYRGFKAATKFGALPIRGIEYEPMKRMVYYNHKKYSLWFPYMQFYLYGFEMYVSVTDNPINKGSELLNCMLPNISSEQGSVCMPNLPRKTLEEYVTLFWNSGFNMDRLPIYENIDFFLSKLKLGLVTKFKWFVADVKNVLNSRNNIIYDFMLDEWQKRDRPPKFPPLGNHWINTDAIVRK